MLQDLIKLGISLLLGLLIGMEREKNDKPAGLRTIVFITLGATLTVLFTLKFVSVTKRLGVSFDAIRAIAYYLVAISFVGGGIITRNKRYELEGITTSALLLPMAVIGLLCGIGEFVLAIIATLIVYSFLLLKFYRIKIRKVGKKK